MLVDANPGNVRWIPTAIARRRLGVSKQRIYQLVKSGKLAACRIDGIIMISTQSVTDRLLGKPTGGEHVEEYQ